MTTLGDIILSSVYQKPRYDMVKYQGCVVLCLSRYDTDWFNMTFSSTLDRRETKVTGQELFTSSIGPLWEQILPQTF
jgi:hypothetical protein